MSLQRQSRPLAERFWSRVDRRGPDECWLWTGSQHSGGYGLLWDGYTRPATHIALEFAGRPLAPGHEALHTCDNPPCVNPAHLLAGTRLDNMRDAVAKGRVASGERNGQARFTAAQVRAIREAVGSDSEVAAQFGTSRGHVYQIRTRKRWASVP